MQWQHASLNVNMWKKGKTVSYKHWVEQSEITISVGQKTVKNWQFHMAQSIVSVMQIMVCSDLG